FALVTGGGSGLGKVMAAGLVAAGWQTAICGRRADVLAATAGEIGAVAIAADVGDPASVRALFAAVEARFGRLDLLVNNAGRAAPPLP
ncbi:SDR family NAD(P)-dependent oxidoreductase, partial [Mycobacterium tuberculosis]|nr:SDR family NAD(P)-dependent oxidoreductase [Mycobacterium tuberculosis]